MDLHARTRAVFDLISSGDESLVEQLIHPAYVDTRGPRGQTGFVAGLRMIRAAFPDWTSEPLRLCAEGDTVAAIWTTRGTHQGEFLGMPATGGTVEMRESGMLDFKDGRLIGIDRVADELTLLRQLGALPAGV